MENYLDMLRGMMGNGATPRAATEQYTIDGKTYGQDRAAAAAPQYTAPRMSREDILKELISGAAGPGAAQGGAAGAGGATPGNVFAGMVNHQGRALEQEKKLLTAAAGGGGGK